MSNLAILCDSSTVCLLEFSNDFYCNCHNSTDVQQDRTKKKDFLFSFWDPCITTSVLPGNCPRSLNAWCETGACVTWVASQRNTSEFFPRTYKSSSFPSEVELMLQNSPETFFFPVGINQCIRAFISHNTKRPLMSNRGRIMPRLLLTVCYQWAWIHRKL